MIEEFNVVHLAETGAEGFHVGGCCLDVAVHHLATETESERCRLLIADGVSVPPSAALDRTITEILDYIAAL